MDSQFSPRIKDVLTYSREEAIRLGNEQIGPEHIFLGILRDGEGIAIDILTNLGVNLTEIKKAIEDSLRTESEIDPQASIQLFTLKPGLLIALQLIQDIYYLQFLKIKIVRLRVF